MRLIEQDAILDHNICFDIECDNCSFVNGAKCKLRQRVFAMPTIDAEPVRHGHWVICSDGYYPYCSKCKQEPGGKNMTNYCPNCGAKMDEVSE